MSHAKDRQKNLGAGMPLNVVVIKTDQQRGDTIAALGNPHMITPNLDRLVGEGVAFTKAYCCGATCIASRAAFYTGQYPHNTGCYSFDEWAHNRTWVHELKDAGFRTAAIGKVHHSPNTEMMAFDERVYVENFPEMEGDHDDYARYLKENGLDSACREMTKDGRWLEKCTSDVFPFDEKHHPDTFIGRKAIEWIQQMDKESPFFLHVGFQGPHDPYDPPQRFLELYDNVDVPLPHKDKGGLDSRLPLYRARMETLRRVTQETFDRAPAHGVWSVDLENKTDEDLIRMRKHYYAKVTQLDEQIGLILDALEERSVLDETLLIFTTDHGDNLGDHDLMYKWVMTEQALHVPFLVRLPNAEQAGRVDDGLCSQMDVGPTVLTALGLEVPERLDGQSNWKRWTKNDRSEVPDKVYCEDNYLLAVRSETRKLIYYAGQEHHEYFDIEADPWEEVNLAEHPDCRQELLELKAELFDWLSVSSYLRSVAHVNNPKGQRGVWPAYHPHDPHSLFAGSTMPEPELA